MGMAKKLSRVLMLPVVVLMVMVCWAPSASAAEPWWHLAAGARPTDLHLANRNEEQEIQASANGSGYLVVALEVDGVPVACLANTAAEASCESELHLPADRTAAQLRSSLAGVYGASVEVGAGQAGGESFTVTTPEREVMPLQAVAKEGTASVAQTAEGGSGRLVLMVFDLGDAATSGPVTLTDKLPAGLVATRAAGTGRPTYFAEEERDPRVTCSDTSTVECTFTGVLKPYERLEVVVWVSHTTASGSPEQNEASVSGGGAREVSKSSTVSFGEGAVPFGVEAYEMEPEEEGGLPDAQAGSHPYQLTTSLRMNETAEEPYQPAQPRNLQFYLPAGLVGDAQATPQCSYGDFVERVAGKVELQNACPADTAVGVSMQNVIEFQGSVTSMFRTVVPVFNITPARGEPARFGFMIKGVTVILNTSVRTGGDYGVTVTVRNLAESIATVTSSIVSIWGDPADHRHDISRGWECLPEGPETNEVPACESSLSPSLPLLTLPSACEPFQAPMQAQSWVPGSELLPKEDFKSEWEGSTNSCNQLPFDARIETAPDVPWASTPSGLKVDVHVPQEAALNPEGLTDADVRTIEVTLPAGMTLNPSAADGLQGCTGNPGDLGGAPLGSPGDQIGYTGSAELEKASEPGHRTPQFTPYLPGSLGALSAGDSEQLEPGSDFCPNASKIAEASITTPLLPKGDAVKGSVYLASPQNFGVFPAENPFSKHVAMYIVAEDPVSGALVKLPGKVELGGEPGVEGLAPGQIRSTFEDSPQLPFEDAELHFFGGGLAPLATPAHCGTYTTDATFTPWSGGAPVSSRSSFDITSGPNGGPCPGSSLPFGASLQSGTTSNSAGAFSPLTTTLSRPDGNQSIQSVTLHYPQGVSGLLSGVELCPEPRANAGTCGPNSQIGETIVSVGVGGDPFTVTGGKVYITGPYEGAPFGLSIVNPAKAGPFDLQEGRPVVVRAKVEVDPHTAALTITTDESGEHAIPSTIEGFALQIQHVNVLVNRPGFTFNPTSCNPAEITGEIKAVEGASAPVKTSFQVANCANLKFTPKFSVSTQGHTSKAGGASLTAKLAEPSEPFGSQANIAKVKVELPEQLPSRLTTLQKACTNAQFEANPAGCPSASFIGHAIVHTPLLPVPLEGPAIFVSHGGESFPSLTMVLQGYGVTVDLVGTTYISKSGVTSTTFKTVPDVPFNTFELTLPEGPYSALTANANLCAPTKTVMVKKKVKVKVHGKTKTVTRKVKKTEAVALSMPTEFIAQNGAEIHETTPISVTECAKKTTVKHAKKKKGHKGKKGKKK